MRYSALSVALALLAAPLCASADPVALRGADLGPSVVLAGGVPDLSVAAWLTPTVGLAVESQPIQTLGASVGTRATLLGGPRGGGLDGFFSGGLAGLRVGPGVALAATFALHARYRSERVHFSAGLASPWSLALAPAVQWRAPLQLELALTVRAGPLWLGAQAGAALVFAPNLSPSLGLQANLVLAVPFRR